MEKLSFGPILLALFFIAPFVYSQERIESHFDSKTCSVVKRLDEKNGVYENVTLQNQGALGTCYANTASMSLLGFYNKEHPDNKINQLSWLHLAFMTQKEHLLAIDDGFYEDNHKLVEEVFERGGRLCPLYEAVKGKKVCELKSDFYDEASYKKNLESNPDTLIKIIHDFEDLLAIDDFYQTMKNPHQKTISPSCINRLDRSLDKKIAKLITPKLNKNLFEELFSLKHPDISVEEFYQAFKEKFIVENFTKKNQGSNMLSASYIMQLNHYPDFSFSTTSPESLKFIQKYFAPSVIEDDNSFAPEAFDKFYNLGNKINETFQPTFNQIHEDMRKELVSCINQTLNGVDEILISLGAQEGTCHTSTIGEKVADTYIGLLSKGFAPNYLLDLLNSKDLYTRESLFEEMMSGLYDNCEVEIPSDLNCDYWSSYDLNEEDVPADIVFAVVKDQIDNQGVSAYIGLDFDFNRSEEAKNNYRARLAEKVEHLKEKLSATKNAEEKISLEDEIYELETTRYTHALSVIGYSEGCSEERKRCLLIQNSYGDEFSGEEGYYSPSIIPDKERVSVYDGEEYRMKSYGKFWLCDEELINKNFESVSRLRK